VAQISSLAGIVGFIAAIALHSAIFRAWGLTFLQIATPSDVLLSGLQLAIQFLLPFVAFALGWWIGRSLHAISSALIWRVGLSLVWTSLILAYVLLQRRLETFIDYTVHVSVAAFLFASIMAISERLSDLITSSDWALNKVHFWRGLWLGAILSYCGSVIVTQFNRIEENGIYGVAWLIKPRLENCSLPRVFWTGERAVVVRCFQTGEFRILHQAENVEMSGSLMRVTNKEDLLHLNEMLPARRQRTPGTPIAAARQRPTTNPVP